MKKLLLISILAVSFFVVNAQNNGYVSKVTEYIILQGDTIRFDSPIDGEVLKRVGGIWTNGTGGAGSAAVDSLVWNFSNGYLGWYISGSVSDSISLDNRYVELSDTAASGAYYSQNQIDNLLVSAQTTVFGITLPINGTLSGSVAAAVEGTDYPTGWVLSASGNDLIVTHNLGRYSANVNVFYNHTGSKYRQLRNFADAFQGHVMDENEITVESITTLYTAYKLKIEIILR